MSLFSGCAKARDCHVQQFRTTLCTLLAIRGCSYKLGLLCSLLNHHILLGFLCPYLGLPKRDSLWPVAQAAQAVALAFPNARHLHAYTGKCWNAVPLVVHQRAAPHPGRPARLTHARSLQLLA